jgi:hypothetical protein
MQKCPISNGALSSPVMTVQMLLVIGLLPDDWDHLGKRYVRAEGEGGG